MQRRIVIFLALGIIACIVGFSIYYSHPTPERVVSRLLNELQNGDIRGGERYTTDGLGLDSSNRRAKKLYKAMYTTMRYAVIDSAIDTSASKVHVTITMVDMEKQITAASYHMLDNSLSGSAANRKKLYELLTEQIKTGSTSTTTNSVTVLLIRDGKNRWRVDSGQNEDFLEAITGGVGPF